MKDYKTEGSLAAQTAQDLPGILHEIGALGPGDHLENHLGIGIGLEETSNLLHELLVTGNVSVVDQCDPFLPEAPDDGLGIALACFSGGGIADVAYGYRAEMETGQGRRLKKRTGPPGLGERAVLEPGNDSPALLTPVRKVLESRSHLVETIPLAAESENTTHFFSFLLLHTNMRKDRELSSY